jgi:hypothetical protein
MKKQGLDNLLGNEDGNVGVALLLGAATMPVCAYLGSYLGEGVGWLTGNIIDYIPLARNVAPWIGERTGLIQDAKTAIDLSENLYQTAGAVSGFWGGLWGSLWFPIKLIAAAYKDD